MAQLHPAENGHAGVTFERWYEDDILGSIHPESAVMRDEDGLLRRIDDLGERDRDHILADWNFPVENDPPDP